MQLRAVTERFRPAAPTGSRTLRVIPVAGVAALGLSGEANKVTDKPAPNRQLSRRRRANVTGGRKHSHRVLVTEFEEARLSQLAEAQRVTVPRLLIEAALAGQGETSTQRREAMVELFAIRRALVNTANNVNQLARAANSDERAPFDVHQVLGELDERLRSIDSAIDGLREPL